MSTQELVARYEWIIAQKDTTIKQLEEQIVAIKVAVQNHHESVRIDHYHVLEENIEMCLEDKI